MTILTVGSGKQFATVSAAIAASQNGDTIQVQAGTYVNDYAIIGTNITLQAVGGTVSMVSTGLIPNGKAILVINASVTINGFAFSGAQVDDGNGAGIRYQSGNLTLNNDTFFDNEDGLLAADNPTGTITINNSEFYSNGIGDGYTHNLYVGNIQSLTINNSYFHEANIGHEIKSRAQNTTIQNSRIEDLNGTASYSIDLPNGGNALISNNYIEQGPLTDNPIIIAFGEEGTVYPNSNLQIIGNQIVNDLNSPSARAVNNPTSVTAQITNNQFYGLTASQIAVGPNSQSGDIFLTSRPPDPLQNAQPSHFLTVQTDGTHQVDFLTFSGPLLVASSLVSAPLWNVAASGDFNNDGALDLVTQGPAGDFDFVYLKSGVMIGSALVGSYWPAHGAGDFGSVNGATGPAVVTQDSLTHQIDLLWFGGGGALAGSSLLQGSYWDVVGAGDFYGDGKTEIVTQSASGQIDLLSFNGAHLAESLLLNGSYWSVKGVDDFDHNGVADLLTQGPTGQSDHLVFNGPNLVASYVEQTSLTGSSIVDASLLLNHV